jgi:hypothetical protein
MGRHSKLKQKEEGIKATDFITDVTDVTQIQKKAEVLKSGTQIR